MTISAVRAVALRSNFTVHGVPATVTRPSPDDDPIATRLIWLTPIPEDRPGGLAVQEQDPTRIAALRRDEVPTVPRRTRIVAPRKAGEDDRGWLVEGTDRVEDDHVRVIVLEDPDWIAE